MSDSRGEHKQQIYVSIHALRQEKIHIEVMRMQHT